MAVSWRCPAVKARAGFPLLALALLLTACGVARAPSLPKIALLAPFEGRYRAIGYNALYAAQLAFAEGDAGAARLLPVDDGGSVHTAADRMRALALDPAVAAIIALGPFASHPQAQAEATVPLLLLGNWGHARADDDALYLAHAQLVAARSADDLLMLEPARDSGEDLRDIVFTSSAALAADDFRARYQALTDSEPNLLATLVYDAARLALYAVNTGQAVGSGAYRGINGEFHFEDGYWRGAPIHRYRYQAGRLIAAG